MRPIMDFLISPYQATFVPSRWIVENSINVQETSHSFKKKKGNGMIGIKLNMQKGYDKNEWGYFFGCSI